MILGEFVQAHFVKALGALCQLGVNALGDIRPVRGVIEKNEVARIAAPFSNDVEGARTPVVSAVLVAG